MSRNVWGKSGMKKRQKLSKVCKLDISTYFPKDCVRGKCKYYTEEDDSCKIHAMKDVFKRG